MRPIWRSLRSATVALGSALLQLGGALAAVGTSVGTSVSVGTVPKLGLLLYRLKQTVIANAPTAIFSFSVAAIIFGGLLFKLVTGGTLRGAAFRAYTLLNNVPSANACEDVDGRGPLELLVANFLFITGALTFAAIIGLMGDAVSSNIDSVSTSNGRVLEAQHTVLVNWGEYTRPMLRQLDAARREGRLKVRRRKP